MLFISRGRTLRFHNLFETNLSDIIRRYTAEGFTGRLVIYLGDYLVELDMLNGAIVAALAQNQKTGDILRGDDVLSMLSSFMAAKEGYVEVVELSHEKVRIDVESVPDSRVSQRALDALFLSMDNVQARSSKLVPSTSSESLGGPSADSSMLSSEAARIANDVAALLRIVLRAEKQDLVEAPSIGDLIRRLGGSKEAVIYARCKLPGDEVANVVCLPSGCAAVALGGKKIDLGKGPVTCKVYSTSRKLGFF